MHLSGNGIYINHSCSPSIGIKDTKSLRQYYALKNISAGEEIFYDYSTREALI